MKLFFNEENFQNMYKKRLGRFPSSVSLVILSEGAIDRPQQIINLEQFKGSFDDLWQDAITPKYKLDRSYTDNLEDQTK
jgi:hypothetical protein